MLFRLVNIALQRQNGEMFGWLRALVTPVEPNPPRLSARVTQLENLSEDLESRIDYLASELKKVRGRQFALEKRSQDDSGETIDERADAEGLPSRPSQFPSTAHLARRFRTGG